MLNKYLARDNHPIPLIEDQLMLLNNKKYFSRLDLKNGFFHINVSPESVKYTAFVTPLGHFEYLKMPFGLKVGPPRFQRFICEAFSKLIESGDVSIYLDDVLVITETIERQFNILSKVFRLLVRNKMELRLDKCEFLATKIEYLGYLITEHGIQPTKDSIAAIEDFPIPRNTREVQSFLGLSSYFRKFIEKFAQIAKPLYDLIKSNTTFRFDSKELESFEAIKCKLTSVPLLAIYSPKDPTELHCDASSLGYGAILMQRKIDLQFHPIFYFSKRTSDRECRYHSFELETLAIIYALRRFRIYLHGINFKIITDCESLRLTLNKRDVNPRISRWALELQDYDYSIEHRPGNRMQHVDALSRASNILVIDDNPLEYNLAVCQKKDPKIETVRNKLEKREDTYFEMRNGIVYRKAGSKLLFYVPIAMENNVLFRYHDEMGHYSVEKTMSNISNHYWFPHLKTKVEEHVRNCLKCIAFSPTSGQRKGLLHSIPKGHLPFHTLHIDFLGPLDKNIKLRQHVFLIIDAFTKYVKLFATKTTSSREAIHSLTDYFRNFSVPRVIISDRGTAFTSQEFKDFITEHDIVHVLIATGSPQANGQAERINRIITPMLAKLADKDNRLYWYKILPKAEFYINNTINKSTGEAPSKLLFGVMQRGKLSDSIATYLDDQTNDDSVNLKEIRSKAADKIVISQQQNETRVNKKRNPAPEYQSGDFVMIRNFDNTPGTSKKLIPKFKGPYVITKKLRNNRYIVSDIEGFQNTQKPYQGTWEACNMRSWRNNQS